MMKNDNFVEVPFEAISFKEDLDSLTTVRNHCPWLNETDRLVVMLIVETITVLMMMTVMSIMMMKKNWYQYLCRVTTSRPRLLLITEEPDRARAQFNRNPARLFFIASQSQMVTLLHHLSRHSLYVQYSLHSMMYFVSSKLNVQLCVSFCLVPPPLSIISDIQHFDLSQSSTVCRYTSLIFFSPSWITPTPTPTDCFIT